MTPIAKLVFGVEYDKTRLTEYAAVLQHARRHAVATGELAAFLERFDGGIKAVVAAERQARKPAAVERTPVTLAERATVAAVSFATDAVEGSAILLIARVAADGMVEVVGSIAGTSPLVDRAVRALR